MSFDVPWAWVFLAGCLAALFVPGHLWVLRRGLGPGAPPRRRGASVSSGLTLLGGGLPLLLPAVCLLADPRNLDDLPLAAFLALLLSTLVLLGGYLAALAGWGVGGLFELPGPPRGARVHVLVAGAAGGLLLGGVLSFLPVTLLLESLPGLLLPAQLAVWTTSLAVSTLAAVGVRAAVAGGLATRAR